MKVVIHTRTVGGIVWFLLRDWRVVVSGVDDRGIEHARASVERELATRGLPPLSSWDTWQRNRITVYDWKCNDG